MLDAVDGAAKAEKPSTSKDQVKKAVSIAPPPKPTEPVNLRRDVTADGDVDVRNNFKKHLRILLYAIIDPPAHLEAASGAPEATPPFWGRRGGGGRQ